MLGNSKSWGLLGLFWRWGRWSYSFWPKELWCLHVGRTRERKSGSLPIATVLPIPPFITGLLLVLSFAYVLILKLKVRLQRDGSISYFSPNQTRNTDFKGKVFIDSKPRLFTTRVRGKSLHLFECLFYSSLYSWHWACRMNKTKFPLCPLRFCPIGQRQTVNKWIYSIPEGTIREKDAGRKIRCILEWRVEGSETASLLRWHWREIRTTSGIAKTYSEPSPMSIKPSLIEFMGKQAAHWGI